MEGLDGDSGIGGLGEDGRWRELLRIQERRAPESDCEIADAHQRCDHLGRFGKGAICEGTVGAEVQAASGEVGAITRRGLLHRGQAWHTSLAIASLF